MSSKVNSWVFSSGNFLNIPFSPKPFIPGMLSELSPSRVLIRIKLFGETPNFSLTTFGV